MNRGRLTRGLLLFSAVLLSVLPFSAPAWGRSVTVAWDRNPPEEAVTGYIIHWGSTSRASPTFQGYDVSVDVGDVTEATVELPSVAALFYLAVVAYNGYGLRSDFSAELSTSGRAGFVPIITASANVGGSISPSGSIAVQPGADQAFSITAASGYHLSDLLVDGTSVAAATSYTFADVRANHTIAASFAAGTGSYVITAEAEPGGSVTPSGSVGVARGADRSFAITPANGYHVADVTVDGASIGAAAAYTFGDVKANHAISASFAPDTVTISSKAGANGSISPAGSTTVNGGGSQTYAISPAGGYRVADVQVDGRSVGSVAGYTFSNVTSDHAISASFVSDDFTVAATAGPNGSITPAGALKVRRGARQTFTLTPDPLYRVQDLLIDGRSVGALTSYSFEAVAADHTISASFVRRRWTIWLAPSPFGSTVAGVGPGGAARGSSGTPSRVPVEAGGELALTFVPRRGCYLADVLIDGTSVGPVPSYVLKVLGSDHFVSGVFRPVDSDGDGLPDLWEMEHFGDLSRDGSADPDGDGVDNLLEHEYGTDPNVPSLDGRFRPFVQRPVNGGNVNDVSPLLSVYEPLADEELAYEFEIAADPGMESLVANGTAQPGAEGTTSWSVPLPLVEGERYYWRARALHAGRSGPWTEPATFVVDLHAPETVVELELSGSVQGGRENVFQVALSEFDPSPLEVRIPAEALGQDAVFAVGTVSGGPTPQPGVRLGGRVYELVPGGFGFGAPIRLKIPYAEADLAAAGVSDPRDLVVFTFNPETLVWEPVQGVTTDADVRRLEIDVEHFSLYAIGVREETTSAGSGGGGDVSAQPPPRGDSSSGGGGGGGGCFVAAVGSGPEGVPIWALWLTAAALVLGASVRRLGRVSLGR